MNGGRGGARDMRAEGDLAKRWQKRKRDLDFEQRVRAALQLQANVHGEGGRFEGRRDVIQAEEKSLIEDRVR